MRQILKQLLGLVDLYHRQDAEVPTSISRPNYLDFNAMERVLYELKDMIRRMVESYRFCGACICGQDLVF